MVIKDLFEKVLINQRLVIIDQKKSATEAASLAEISVSS